MSKKCDKFLRNERWLYQQYWIEGLSIRKIGEKIGCCGECVRRAFKYFDIPRRSISESLKGEKHPLYGKTRSEKTKQKISKSLKGQISPNKGKHPSEETRQKLRIAHKGKRPSKETRMKQSAVRKGRHHSKETIAKMREAHKGNHPTEETKQKLREARKRQKFPKHHTMPELIFEKICKEHNLPFKYTGDGSFWIKNINPDFVECDGKKIAVEIFGDYWHSPLLNWKLKEKGTLDYRKRILKEYGWKLIVFWETDLKREDAEPFVLSELKKNKVF